MIGGFFKKACCSSKSFYERLVKAQIQFMSTATNNTKIPVVRPQSHQRKYLERLQSSNPKLFHIFTRALSPHSTTSAGHAFNSSSTKTQPQFLKKKSMQDSFVEEFLRFKSDPSIKDDYVNMYGAIRMGKLLEDFDALAGAIAYLHCYVEEHSSAVTIVTASVDRIDLASPIPPNEDLRLSGHVTCRFFLIKKRI